MGEIGLHAVMRASVQFDFLDRLPAQAAKQEHVLALHMRQEARAASGMGGGNREPDQGGAQRADAAVMFATASREPHQRPGSSSCMRTVPTTASA